MGCPVEPGGGFGLNSTGSSGPPEVSEPEDGTVTVAAVRRMGQKGARREAERVDLESLNVGMKVELDAQMEEFQINLQWRQREFGDALDVEYKAGRDAMNYSHAHT